MGKNHKHKKKLKSERAKTHILSKTKFLPKGLNVTNTTFKIRPLIVPNQLKNRSNDPFQVVSKRNFTVKECLQKLKHHGDKSKEQGAEELLEMLKVHRDILDGHLWECVPLVAAMIQNKEKKVRKAAIGLIGALTELPSQDLRDFFNHISINLRCAMTHISGFIQEDSLLFLDKLLVNVPDLVAENAPKIFGDFLALISKLRRDSTGERTLTMNMGAKYTSVQWRIAVLSRLCGILKIVVNEEKKLQKSEHVPVVNIMDSYYIPVYRYRKALDQTPRQTESILNQDMESFIPILEDVLMEILPEKPPRQESTILTEEASVIFSFCIQIFNLLYTYAQLRQDTNEMAKIFASKPCGKFIDKLLLYFPFTKSSMRDGSVALKDVHAVFQRTVDSKCTKENILICHFVCALKNVNSKAVKSKLDRIISYINECLLNPPSNPNTRQIVIKLLKTILLDDFNVWKSIAGIKDVLENTVDFYRQTQTHSETFSLLNILQNWDELKKLNSESYSEWFRDELPLVLCRTSISEETIDFLLKLSLHPPPEFIEGVTLKFDSIRDNLKSIQIESENVNLARRLLMQFFLNLGRQF